MRILTTQDIPLIIEETDTYLISKHAYSDLHIVSVKENGRDFGLASLEDAREFASRRLWETADQDRLERLKFAFPHLFQEQDGASEEKKGSN